MPRILERSLLSIGIATTLAFLAGVGWSFFRFGYAWSPPSHPRGFEELRLVERASWYSIDATAEEPLVLDPLGEDPHDRVAGSRNLRRRWLRPDRERALTTRWSVLAGAPPESVAPEEFARLREVLPRGTTSGIVASGIDADGRRVLLATALGPELSNDHYPYREVSLEADRGRVDERAFRVDVAGLEGFTAQRVGHIAFAIAAPVLLGVTLAIEALRSWRRRRAEPA